MHTFRNWTKLIVLSIFENSNLDWDLGTLENMSKLQHVLVQGCGIKGTLPQTNQMINLQRLIARENVHISGSISAELVAGSVDLVELDLSNTRFNSS